MADNGPKFGRRAQEEPQQSSSPTNGDAPRPVVKGWGEDTLAKEDTMMSSPTGGSDMVDVPTLDAGVDDAAASHHRAEEDEALAKEVASAPVEYHSAMPKLSELDMGVKWAKIHAKCNEEIDMTCLTNVLSQQLDDDDVPWIPDMLLVQLTSELLDVAEQRDEIDAAKGSPTMGAAGSLEGMTRKRGSIKA
ncbi:Hypothetical protein, putative [Bodo saltans]|uniref:Intraflagellar transport protein 43 n=1 Tax=Bodo saltans TaxID=75058 RepID=A0A0S4J770_BODSA|nr:Hypothetical protein, putative [Bodo saltans]|eukprot:CUG85787.1 Hypothetical protein, putative [Bodo saltans]